MSQNLGLADFIGAVAASIHRSTEPIRRQHIEATADWFEPDDGEGAEPGTLKPKTVSMLIPRHTADAENRNTPVKVPLASLVQQNPVVLEEVAMTLDCRLVLAAPTDDPANELRICLEPTGAGAVLRISLKYRHGDVPEGAARLDDAMVRGL